MLGISEFFKEFSRGSGGVHFHFFSQKRAFYFAFIQAVI